MTEKYCTLLEDKESDDSDEFLIKIDFENNININIFLIKDNIIDKLKFIFKLLFNNKGAYKVKSKNIQLTKYQIDEIRNVLDEYEITYYRKLDNQRKEKGENT